MDNLALFQNMDSLEESHEQLTQLIERLDRDSHIDAHEMGNLVTGMGGLLGQFSTSHHELQNEMKDLLESSKNGLLTHEKLVEMVHNESIRSKFMNKLIDSLKIQIENLFHTFVNKDDSEDGQDEMMEKVASNVNLMWKSVNSLSTLMESPAKKLDHTIRKIDSEVIVHLSQNNNHDRIFADSNREQFTEKIDNQLRSAKERRKNSQSPHRLANALSPENLDLTDLDNMEAKPTAFRNNGKKGGNDQSSGHSYGAANKASTSDSKGGAANQGNDRSPKSNGSGIKLKSVPVDKGPSSMSNTSDKMHADNNKHQNDYGNGNNDASSFRQNSNDQYNAEGGNSYGGNNGSSYAPNHGEDDGDFNSGDNDDNISAISNVSKSSKGHGGDHHSSHKGKSSGNGSSSSHKGKGDHSNSSSVKGGGKNSGTKIDTAPIHENEVFHDSAAGKGSYSENNSLKSNGKVGSEIGKGSASVSLAGKTNTSDKGHVTSTRLGQPNKVMDDESSIESGFPVAGGSGFTNIPPDVTELMRILKEKEAVLIKRETDIENEVKQKVKEYIRSHGIGYQKKSISGASILEPKLLEDSDGVMREEGHDDNPDRNKDGEIVFRDSLTNEYGGSSLLRDASLQRSNSFQMPTSGRARSRDGGSRDGDNNSPSKSRQTSRERKMDQTQLEQNKFKELHDLKNKNTGTSGRPNSRGTRQGTWRTITPLPRALDSQEIKSRVDVEQSYPHLGTLHEIIDLIVNNINHKFNGDLKTLDLIKIVTPKIPIKQDMSTDTEDLDAKKPWELPIYHNHANLMITRTYKVTPELQSFLDKLATDDNPLKLIFDEFGDFLPALQKERLSFAAMSYPERKHRDQVAQKLPVTSQDWFKLNTNLYGSMNELFEACMNMLPMISAIEKIAHEVIQFIKSMKKSGIVNIADIRSLMQNNSSNIKLLQGSLVDLYRLFGDLQAQEISNHLRLYEFRAFFERINVMGPYEMKNLFAEFPDFQKCHQAFNAAQGQVFEVHRRIIECRDRCNKHEIFSLMLISQQQLSQQLSESMTGGSHIIDEIGSITIPPLVTPTKQQISLIQSMVPLQIPGGGNNGSYGTPSGPISAIPSTAGNGLSFFNPNQAFSNQIDNNGYQFANQSHVIGQLQEELLACHEEIEDLELELLHVMKERDRTPGAILFFTLMHDPAFIPNLQQLTLQFQQVRGFLDYSVEMDYVTLRKRLQVCLTLMPTIDKLVDKYSLLHKQWTHHRLNYFAERKLRGNAADNLGCCPLCYHELDRIDNAKPITKINKAIADAEEKAVNKNTKKDRTARLPSSHQARKRMSATLSMLPNGQIGVPPQV